MQESSVQRRLREHLAASAERKQKAGPVALPPVRGPITPTSAGPAPWAQYASAAPAAGDGFIRSDSEIKIDDTLEALTVLESYNRYCRKMSPRVGGKREGVMISCPKPDHPDKTPSAWMNLDNNTWFCGGCQEGGDQYDIAAFHFGYDNQSYKSGQNWGIFRKTLAQDLGLVIEYVPGYGEVTYEVESESSPESQEVLSTAPHSTGTAALHEAANATSAQSEDEAKAGSTDFHLAQVIPEDRGVNALDWRPLCPSDTFLAEFMKAVSIDDVPEEYHFWHAMMALGLTVGRDVCLVDNPEVHANLFICLLGSTGSGKSKAKRYIASVMHEAAPFDPKQDQPDGVKMVATPASAEAMIKAFQKEYLVPSPNGKMEIEYASVRGFVEFPELTSLTTRMKRTGSTLQPTLIEFFDAPPSISSVAASKDGERYAYKPTASVLTTVQPEVLGQVFSDADEASGFLNRWLFVTGQRKRKQLFNRTIIELGDAIIRLRRIHTWGSKIRKVVWSDDALAVFQKAWDEYIQADVFANPLALVRIDLVIKKLGLLFAINEQSDTVTAEMVERVLKIYPYLKRNVEFKTDSMIATGEAALDEAILEAVKKLGPGMHSGRAITRKLVRKFREAGQPVIDRHITSLAKSGFLQTHMVASGTAGGRPTNKYSVASE